MRFTNADPKQMVKARNTARYALIKGTLKKEPCSVCGNEDSHAHHWDYSKPLEVQWLCRSHHIRLHHRVNELIGEDVIEEIEDYA